MASAISLEYLQSIESQPGGLATLDSAGTIPENQLPVSALSQFKGEFADEAALIAAHPTATLGSYAYVEDTNTNWYWNRALSTPAWVNQEITAAAYIALSAAEKAAVPYIITA